MTTWGKRIEVNGVRPDWLRNEPFKVFTKTSEITGMPPETPYQWAGTIGIALAVDHPYYAATDAGYIYWPGGDKAPDDWDGGPVLLKNGVTDKGFRSGVGSWHGGFSSSPIGYNRRQSAPPLPSPQFEGMTWSMIDGMIQAVKAGDLIAAKAYLPMDPAEKIARTVCEEREIPFDWRSDQMKELMIECVRTVRCVKSAR